MSRTVQQQLQEIADIVGGSRALADQALGVVRQLGTMAGEGRAAYRREHWGNAGSRGVMPGSVPDASSGVIEIGRLAEITYLTRKGRDAQTIAYVHRFGAGARDPRAGDPGRWGDPRTMPILSHTYEERPSGLVVVRDRSRYTVTTHGIEG